MKTKLIRVRVCPDITAPDNSIAGSWHKGWRLPGSTTIAFYTGRKWYTTLERFGLPLVEGPFADKNTALEFTYPQKPN